MPTSPSGIPKRVTLDYPMMNDKVGYTPYEGHGYKGWPTTVLSRGGSSRE